VQSASSPTPRQLNSIENHGTLLLPPAAGPATRKARRTPENFVFLAQGHRASLASHADTQGLSRPSPTSSHPGSWRLARQLWPDPLATSTVAGYDARSSRALLAVLPPLPPQARQGGPGATTRGIKGRTTSRWIKIARSPPLEIRHGYPFNQPDFVQASSASTTRLVSPDTARQSGRTWEDLTAPAIRLHAPHGSGSSFTGPRHH